LIVVTPPPPPPVFVLCKLYIGEDDLQPRTVGVIVSATVNVYGLKKAIVAEARIELAHTYRYGTTMGVP
jgi:hypothetical protein